ncbi:MAG: arginine N-succinyltransferase, partial [Massilia sp.]|nr:arginine N-succinyltransferase [Massilia sp.]
MYVARPVEQRDIGALETLAAVMTPGVHTLPRTRDTIAAFVERSIASFAAQVDIPSEESYLFVLEDTATGDVVGTAAVHASAGSNGTYFAFRNDVIQQVSRDLNICHSVHALTLCSELTACSQLAGFHLRDREHAGIEAALLSRARLLYAVMAPNRFGDRFFVPLAGVTDADGESAFWNALGRKFFKMDFLDAERVIGGTRNRTMIVELMPHYPVYVPLLPGDAQAAMGQI